jgi:hypothetical protein
MESPCQAAGNDFVWEDLRQAIREEYGNDIISPAKPAHSKKLMNNQDKITAPHAPKLLQEKRQPLGAVNQNTLAANQYPLVQPIPAVKKSTATSAQGSFRLRISDGNKNSATPAASAAM